MFLVYAIGDIELCRTHESRGIATLQRPGLVQARPQGICFSIACQCSGKVTHLYFDFVQVLKLGSGSSGSLKQPAETPVMPGNNSALKNTVDPHCGQKCVVLVLPLSTFKENCDNFPDASSTWLSLK